MTLLLITPPAIEPISLAEARLQCRIDDTVDDTLLAIYIQSARQQAEHRLGRSLITQTWERVLDAWPTDIRLGRPPVLSVVSVTYIGADLQEHTVPSTDYALDSTTEPGYVIPVSTWPTAADVANAVRVRFTCGYGPAATDVPAPVRSWMLLTVGALSAQREAVDLSGRSRELPSRFWDALLDAETFYGVQ